MDGQRREPHPEGALTALPALLHDGDSPAAQRVLDSAADVEDFGTDVDATLRWVVSVGADAPRPGEGSTHELFELLATTAALDVGAARMLEPHLDALAILAQAGTSREGSIDVVPSASWGVFAAEGPAMRLDARLTGDGWRLSGTKPWCSLAGSLSHALVTAWTDERTRGLFAVRLRDRSVSPHPGPWVSRGLSQIISAPVEFDTTPAVPVGEPGWYLQRPGFAWGGIGVAAAWWGGALPIVAKLTDAARSARADQLATSMLGEADAIMWGARAALADAAAAIDARVDGAAAKVLAQRARAVVATAVERVLTLADHALGPAPLTADESYARRGADLHIYLRQHHGERDLARLGGLVAGA